MKRCRFLFADWPVSLADIAKHMQGAQYSDDGPTGFQLKRVRPAFIEASFYERHKVEEHMIDPLGKTTSYERTYFSEVSFTLATRYPQIQLLDPPRGLRSFLNALTDMTGLETVVESLQVDPLRWAEAVRSEELGPIRIDLIEVADLVLSAEISGRLIVAGAVDVRKALRVAVPSGTYSVRKTALSFEFLGRRYSALLASDASLRCSREIPDELFPLLRSALPRPEFLGV